MRRLLLPISLAIGILISLTLSAQSGPFYVAAKSGLSIREKPEAASKVLDKIPYGTKITLVQSDEEWVQINTEGIPGYWKKVKYNNKTGYIVDSYLFPVPPPKVGIKDMRGYISQISLPFGARLVVKSTATYDEEAAGWELHKQLYKNGAEWHKFQGYEYGSDTYFLPDFTIQQAFLLLRMIPEFNDVFGEKDEFPSEDKAFKKGEREYKIYVDKEDYGSGVIWVKRIAVEYEDGAIYDFEMYQIDNQIVIFFGSGV